MARSQRVSFGDGAPVTYTVLGADHLPVPAVVDYLQFLRDDAASPHTIRAYAAGLATWWTVLEHTGIDWQEIPTRLFGEFLTYLRTGDLPGTARIGQPNVWCSPSTVQQRAAAVLAFYRYQADAHGLLEPHRRLYSVGGKRGRSRYLPMLAGVGTAGQPSPRRPIYTVRRGNRSATPVLLPDHVRLILDLCSTQTAQTALTGSTGPGKAGPAGAGGSGAGREWSGSPSALRDRLLFATLAETGMRLGEALSLRHTDFHIGAGGTPWVEVVPRQDHPHQARVKSADPRRIYIGDDLEALYSAYVWHLVECGADLAVPELAEHFVFVNLTRGQLFAPIRPETVYAKRDSINGRAAAAGAGLPEGWSPHWLRHTHATALLLAGTPPHIVMRRLGHRDIQTTLSTYGWVTEDAEMRSVAQWRNYVAGWKGLHEPNP